MCTDLIIKPQNLQSKKARGIDKTTIIAGVEIEIFLFSKLKELEKNEKEYRRHKKKKTHNLNSLP